MYQINHSTRHLQNVNNHLQFSKDASKTSKLNNPSPRWAITPMSCVWVQHADPPMAPHAPQEGLPQCFPDAVGPWWHQELYMSTPCSGG